MPLPLEGRPFDGAWAGLRRLRRLRPSSIRSTVGSGGATCHVSCELHFTRLLGHWASLPVGHRKCGACRLLSKPSSLRRATASPEGTLGLTVRPGPGPAARPLGGRARVRRHAERRAQSQSDILSRPADRSDRLWPFHHLSAPGAAWHVLAPPRCPQCPVSFEGQVTSKVCALSYGGFYKISDFLVRSWRRPRPKCCSGPELSTNVLPFQSCVRMLLAARTSCEHGPAQPIGTAHWHSPCRALPQPQRLHRTAPRHARVHAHPHISNAN